MTNERLTPDVNAGLPRDTRLATGLLRAEAYPHCVTAVRLIETHISRVFLTGIWAYKVKKPVALGFLDFTTPASRLRACEEELRLNRRLAPHIYESVVAICGTPEHPRVGGPGEVLDYAVKMREFPQHALASEMVARGAFTSRHTDQLARTVAAFHEATARAASDSRFGTAEAVIAPALQNFEALEPLVEDGTSRELLAGLRRWTEHEHAARSEALGARHAGGFVRECHGDLHLRNIVVLDDKPIPFDCIEFNESLRWIDVMSEIAFLLMDFEDRGRRDLAWRFLNAYLEATGDYRGIVVLRFYLVYRALVRAKVHALRARQHGIGDAERARLGSAARDYIALAARYAHPATPMLVITHGVSGSGKTTAAQVLLERLGAVRVRSDIERKRLHGLSPLARSGSVPGGGLYATELTRATYEHLLSLARGMLQAGYTVVVDAAFLRRAEREAFRALAASLHVPFRILAFAAPIDVLKERVVQRYGAGTDASEADLAVLERQLEFRERLDPVEEASTVRIDTATPVEPATVERLLERISGQPLVNPDDDPASTASRDPGLPG